MTTKKIYGPRIKWHGGECPVPPETKVGLRFRSGATETGHRADDYSWRHGINDDNDIVEYCVAIDQPGLDAAEKLLLVNGYTIIPPVKPLTFEDVVPLTEAPPEGTECWVVDLLREEGVADINWRNDFFDETALRRRLVYLKKEHALVAARHIFGLKGGEL